MIPDFNDDGYLPPGVYPATLEEIDERFGKESELRRVQMQSLRWLIELARKVEVRRIVLNGSFVTAAYEPNDVDCALLAREDFPDDFHAAKELGDGLPFLEIALLDTIGFRRLVEQFFATDRHAVPKGMVGRAWWRWFHGTTEGPNRIGEHASEVADPRRGVCCRQGTKP